MGRAKIYKTEKQRKKAFYKQQQAYQQKSMKAFTFRFHNESDKLVIETLQQQENKNDYIRQLVLKDIEPK